LIQAQYPARHTSPPTLRPSSLPTARTLPASRPVPCWRTTLWRGRSVGTTGARPAHAAGVHTGGHRDAGRGP